jgi:hypothetical protein
VVALAVVSVVVTTVAWQCVAGRRLLERRQHQLQADGLARAGVELAAARLLATASYKGESVELIPDSQLRVEVRADPATPDLFRVSCEARFPREGPDVVRRSVTRSLRRTSRDNQVRIEVIPVSPGSP